MDVWPPDRLDETSPLHAIDRIVAVFPEASYETTQSRPPNWCPLDSAMVDCVWANAWAAGRIDPVPPGQSSLGGTGARLWRHTEVPAIIHGLSPMGMNSWNEHMR